MRASRRRFILAVMVLGLLAASPAFSLQKRAIEATDAAPPEWARASDCLISYYNRCTGWVWAWSGWMPGDRVGVSFESCDDVLYDAFVRFAEGAPAGYGYTGELAAYEVDDEHCLVGDALKSEPLLPLAGWNHAFLSAWAGDGIAVVVVLGPAPGNPVEFMTDHPAVGSTGPIACGHCYPTNRLTRSFWWGTAAEPYCPGSPFFDGFCNAELVFQASMAGPPLNVGSSSWAAVKALYR